MSSLFLKLHLMVLIAGFTGIFGRLISLDAFLLVYVRFSLALILFGAYAGLFKKKLGLDLKNKLRALVVGALLALHLVLFYASIKLSNVSVGTLTLSCISFFTAIFEPLVNSRKISCLSLVSSMIGVLGLFLIFHFDSKFRLGIVVGVLSAFAASMFSIVNKKFSKGADPYSALLWQLTGGLLFLSLLIPLYLAVEGTSGIYFKFKDLLYLFLLSSICTVGLYLLQIQLVQKISAFTMNLTLNLEPVYSIILAMLLFNENRELNFSFYLGIMLIVLNVAIQNLSMYFRIKRQSRERVL